MAALEASRTADMDAVGSHDACSGVEEDGESMVEMASAVDSVKDKAGEVTEPNLRVEGDAAIDVSTEQIEKEAAQEAKWKAEADAAAARNGPRCPLPLTSQHGGRELTCHAPAHAQSPCTAA